MMEGTSAVDELMLTGEPIRGRQPSNGRHDPRLLRPYSTRENVAAPQDVDLN